MKFNCWFMVPRRNDWSVCLFQIDYLRHSTRSVGITVLNFVMDFEWSVRR